MGYMKSFIGREHMLMTENVCHECFEDEGLINFIKRNGESGNCDYCDNKKIIVHQIAEVIDYINSSLFIEYEHPADCMGWNGREGGWQGSTVYDSYEILDHVDIGASSDTLFDTIASNLPSEEWCQRDPYQLRDREELTYTWSEFCNLVKYKCRYMFLEHEDREQEKSLERVLISRILYNITTSFKRINLMEILPKGTILKRARYYNSNDPFELTKEELASPPKGVTKSSRMSPAGIPMFYAADDYETAIKEIKIESGSQVALADFKLNEDIYIIDLTKALGIPSLFCEDRRHLRDDIFFLRDFIQDFCKPVTKDGKEHIEYIPTQIVTEFCKYKMIIDDKKIKGFKFPSSVSKGHNSYCLFLKREDFGIKERTYYQEPKEVISLNGNIKLRDIP